MLVQEFRKLNDAGRLFLAMYGANRLVQAEAYTNPVARIAAFYAGLYTMNKDEYIRVMNGAGKSLLRLGIDCRTDAERVRHQLHLIQTGQQVV